jgi:hypothetical protein
MFRLIRPETEMHYVDRGCVQCPLRGRDVELDLCMSCAALTEIELQNRPAFVRCAAAPARPFIPSPWL